MIALSSLVSAMPYRPSGRLQARVNHEKCGFSNVGGRCDTVGCRTGGGHCDWDGHRCYPVGMTGKKAPFGCQFCGCQEW